MKHSIRLTGPNGSHTYLSHRGKTSFSPVTARKYLAEWLACNPGGIARIENQFREPVKTSPRSYFGVTYAQAGFSIETWDGRKNSRIQSPRFRMKRDCENWCDAMMAQPFAHSATVHPSAKAPDLNSLTA